MRDFKLRERIKLATWPNPINTSSTLNIEPNFNKLNATVTSDDWFENHRSSRINYSIILDYFKTPTNKKKVPIKDFIDSVITSKDVAVQTNQSGDLIPLATGFLVHATYLAPLLVAAAGAALIAYRSYRSQPPAFLSSCLRYNSVRPLNNDYAGPVCSALDYDPLRPCRPAWESSPPPPPGGSRLFRPARGLRQNQAGKTNSIIITDL